MLTTFAEMQELGRQVESVSSQSKVSILYSVICRADLSERSILKLHNTAIRLSTAEVMVHGTIRNDDFNRNTG